jgi:hypothetical protein
MLLNRNELDEGMTQYLLVILAPNLVNRKMSFGECNMFRVCYSVVTGSFLQELYLRG